MAVPMKTAAGVLLAALSLAGGASATADSMDGMDMRMDMGHGMSMHAGMDMDAHHHMPPGVKARSVVNYTVPDVKLVREDGKRVSLPAELDDGRPVVLTFIYTTCTTVCPIISQTLSQLQEALGKSSYHIASISIDPEQDTPARLREYAAKFHAGPQWHHYTGSVAASVAAQRAFHVYRGDKMDHVEVVLMRAAPGKPWVRIDGPVNARELAGEFHRLVAMK